MADASPKLIEMMTQVADALGEELLNQVVFVGGVTTGLFVTDEFSKEDVRFTDDVDLIVNIASRVEWIQLQEKLREQGFGESMNDDLTCRMRLGELKVDFMPEDPSILGFSNMWYSEGLANARDYLLPNGLNVRILTPALFVATKLEAHKGRGADDIQLSRDLEDILIVIDGREEIVEEINSSPDKIKNYIKDEFHSLLHHEDFEYTVEGAVRGDDGRKNLIYERMNSVL